MPIEVKIPALGESISSGVLSSWKVAEGSYVEVDQPIYELETDKITQEGLAEVAGVISFLAKEGDEVEIGASIASIDDSASKPAAESPPEEAEAPPAEESESKEEPVPLPKEQPASAAKDEPMAPVKAEQDAPPHSPAVRKVLAETGIDPATVSGTGKGGRLTKADVLAVAEGSSKPPSSKTAAKAQPVPSRSPEPEGRSTRRALSPIRRKIAARLVEAQQTAAILSTFNEVDLSAVMALRKRHQDAFVKQHGVKLGFMSFFVKAVVHALKAVPGLNVRIEGSDLIENHYFDVGVAVGTEKGLVVPVLRDCDALSFAQIEQGIVGYAEKARSGGITLEDMQGGCFTITNGGIYGSMLSTPILNPPRAASSACTRSRKEPWFGTARWWPAR